MKVAFHTDGPRIRGNERQVIRLALGLRDRGHDVVVACRRGTEVEAELQRAGIRTSGARPRGDADVFSALAFAWWLRRERPDVLLLTSWKRAVMAGWAARVAGVPRVVLRIGGVHRIASGARGFLLRHALGAWYHAIIANSRGVAELVFSGHAGIEEKVDVVVNGIEPSEEGPGSVLSTRSAVRAALGIGDSDRMVLAIGSMERRKGFDVLIEALSLAARGDAAHAASRAHVVLAGAGTPEQRSALEAQAAANGVADRVHLLGQRRDIVALLGASDVYVMCSRQEGFPNVATLEAMRAGTPAIVTEVAGAREALARRDGRTTEGGLIVPADNAAALATALGALLADLDAGSDAVLERVTESKWRVENWFALDTMIDGYERVLSGPRGSRPPR